MLTLVQTFLVIEFPEFLVIHFGKQFIHHRWTSWHVPTYLKYIISLSSKVPLHQSQNQRKFKDGMWHNITTYVDRIWPVSGFLWYKYVNHPKAEFSMTLLIFKESYIHFGLWVCFIKYQNAYSLFFIVCMVTPSSIIYLMSLSLKFLDELSFCWRYITFL